ncbi:MAG: hypothetical protein ABIX44_04025 [Cryobacterium sp.]
MLFAGGGVAAVAVGASGLAVAGRTPGAVSATTSPFWTVRILRAGRGARLRPDGLPAFHAAPGPGVFAGPAEPARVRTAVAQGDDHAGHGSTDHSGAAIANNQPVNRTWGDVIVLEVEAFNATAAALPFSPGQLRLRLADGPSITPQDASRGPGEIAAGAVEMFWVSYLAPSGAANPSAEFADTIHDSMLAVRVPELVAAREAS